jgi:C-terminal processing protease CtpA/Prc
MLDYSSGQYRADRGKSIPDLRFEILEEKNTAVITITTFAYYDERDVFYAFLDDAFEKIHTSKIDNLVLDFRDNDGGNPFCTTHLLSHIEPYPVPYFAKLYIGYGRFAQPIPLAGKRFKGDIYILINGGCFSSTGHLCALLKYHKIGMFIGTETGGTYTCNDASKEIILKHTQFRLITARRTFQAAVRGLPKDKGILPDYPVEPTIEDLLNGKDTVLEFTLALLDTKMHSGTLAPSVLK